MAEGRVGYFFHQSPGSDLQSHARWRQAPGRTGLQLRADARGHYARSRSGETMNFITQLFQRRRLQQDLEEEIQLHLEEKVEELVEGGMPREEAEFAARREFGSVTQIEESSRETWRWPTVESVLADCRYGVRMLRKHPGFTLAA